jgi:oligoendopeptidase F
LPKARYEVFDRDQALLVELYRDENVPLETEDAKLGNEFNKLSGSLTVSFRGEEKTLTQMGRLQEDPDRALREEAWKLVADRRLAEADKFDELMDGLVKLRHRMALNAGFANYRDYAFRMRGRFDYTPADCERFHDAIAAEVMPVQRELQRRRREQLAVPALRPWDLSVDPLNRPALKPFADTAEMERGSQVIFDRLDPELAQGFAQMRELRLLDLANRKGKAPGGYQSTLSESRLPFIFMNSVGLQRDVETILHEAGHAFHALATRDEDLYAYRGAPIEFCEVASMAMELLAAPHLDVFYSEADALVGISGTVVDITANEATFKNSYLDVSDRTINVGTGSQDFLATNTKGIASRAAFISVSPTGPPPGIFESPITLMAVYK